MCTLLASRKLMAWALLSSVVSYAVWERQ